MEEKTYTIIFVLMLIESGYPKYGIKKLYRKNSILWRYAVTIVLNVW